jgi:NAD(P)-dependent dehydrogenase (short-subunit alcohol dehydrogenase family)
MSRIFITGSSEGLGLMAGQLLAQQGDQVVLHARNRKRTDDAQGAGGGVVASSTSNQGSHRISPEPTDLNSYASLMISQVSPSN